MIKLKRNTEGQIIVMVKEKIIKGILLKLLIGLIIYFAIINILIYYQFGIPFTPREWLLNPLFNLFIQPNIVAWLLLFLSELAGWIFFESK